MSRKLCFPLLVFETLTQTRISIENQCHSSVLHSGWHAVLVGRKYSTASLRERRVGIRVSWALGKVLRSLRCWKPGGIQFSLGESDVKNPILSSICENNTFSELLFCTLVLPTLCGSGPGWPAGPWWLGVGGRCSHAGSRQRDPLSLVSVGNEAKSYLYGVCVWLSSTL